MLHIEFSQFHTCVKQAHHQSFWLPKPIGASKQWHHEIAHFTYSRVILVGVRIEISINICKVLLSIKYRMHKSLELEIKNFKHILSYETMH